jgi:hypothetical protein
MSAEDFPTISDNVVQELPKASPAVLQTIPPLSVDLVMGTNGSNGAGGHNMKMDVSGNTLYLKGASTRNYIDHLKKLGGTWNPSMMAWVFSQAAQDDVGNFLEAVEAGEIKPASIKGGYHKKPREFLKREPRPETAEAPVESEGDLYLPTINSGDGNFQKLGPRTVYKPLVGDMAKITSGGKTKACRVTKTVTNNKGEVDVALVQSDPKDATKLSQLEITNGHWQVRGYFPSHKIFFEKQ